VPTRVKINTGPSTIDNRVAYSGFYAQDQWTLKRLTLSGGFRYDHATSEYPETCIGTDGNRLEAGGNEPYVPVQVGGSFAGQRSWCTTASEGVSYHNVSPRWAVAWDLFGNGKTSVKWNMGKYLSGAGIAGIYADANPAQRTVNMYTRTWTDVNGNRRVDCDLLNFNEQNVPGGDICGGPTSVTNQDSTRYGRDPLSLDGAGTPIGLATTQCGRREAGIPADVQAYCDVYGDSLLDGWNKRRSEWQFGLGIQHEVLPRVSAEFTYNRRSYANLTTSDQLGIGCDRFNGRQDIQTCQDGYLNFTSPDFGFFRAVAPSNPGLPGGGGYVIRGLANPNATLPVGRPTAVTIMDELSYKSNFFDTNFVWRGTDKWGLRGLRMNGGTTTGRAVRDQCASPTYVAAGVTIDGPNVQQHDGTTPACNPYTRWETSVRGTATYTVLPGRQWGDILVSTVFQRRNGPERNANHAFTKDQVTWEASSAARATAAVPGRRDGWPGRMLHAVGTTITATSYTVNMLNPGELYGPGYTIFD
jgi:opacity protein-like surface antigen